MSTRMSRIAKNLPGLALTILCTANALGQVDSTVVELDLFWAEVVRTVTEGDLAGARATYNPDAITSSVGPNGRGIFRVYDREQNVERNNLVRSGEIVRGLEFKFTDRLHSETEAHEIGMFHFWTQEKDKGRQDVYGRVEAFLIKEDRWMMTVENQDWTASKSEWDEL